MPGGVKIVYLGVSASLKNEHSNKSMNFYSDDLLVQVDLGFRIYEIFESLDLL